MAETLVASPALRLPGAHHGAPGTGLRIALYTPDSMASLAAAAGQSAALAAALATALGWALPDTPRREGNVLWAGPQRWLVLDPPPDLAERAGTLGSVTDQSDSRVLLRLSGARLRDTLGKGVPVDLHPHAFAVDALALTLAWHIAVLLWRDSAQTMVLGCARSYARDLLAQLLEAGAEYGIACD